jgi:hypothetical protein
MLKQILLAVVLFLSSAGGLVVEIVAGRLIAPYVGMSLYTWTSIIAVVLAGLSVGHWIGGRLAGPDMTQRTGFLRLAVALALAGLSTLFALVVLSALALLLLGSGLGPIVIVILLTGALFLAPSLFVGVVAPIVTKLAVDAEPTQTGRVFGRMYAIGTLGSILGTLASGYLFISWIGSSGTLIAVTTLYAVLAMICAVCAGRKPAAVVALAVLLPIGGLVGVGSLIGGGAAGVFDSRCTVESDYFCIQVDDFAEATGRPSALMALDNLVHSINDREDPSLLYSPYVQFVDEYARRRFAGGATDFGMTAFFVGGGGYSLPRSWAATIPGAKLLVAEIDPEVTRVAADRLWLDPSSPALDIRHRDARTVLQSLPPASTFDVVFGDAFHDISIPTHLISREFHAEVNTRLKSDGFYAVNVVDSAGQPGFLFSLTHTLGLEFSEVEIWVDGDELSALGRPGDARVTYIVIASNQASNSDEMQSVFGIRRRWQRIDAQLGAGSVWAAPQPEPVVLTDDFAPVERLMFGVLTSAYEAEQ